MMKDRMIQNGIEYERRGEQYYPLLDLGEQTSYEIGKYGNLHLAFIKQHRRGTYTTLLTENRLNEHLHGIDEQAHEQIDLHAFANLLKRFFSSFVNLIVIVSVEFLFGSLESFLISLLKLFTLFI